jgi:hypothetical protein
MNEQSQTRQQEVALFRYRVIADLVRPEPGTPGLYNRIKSSSRRNHLAVDTIRRWLTLYQRGGLDALRPKTRRTQPTKEGPR